MPSAHTALILGTAAALAPAPLAPLARAGPHGLPLLPSGEHLNLDAPGWVRSIGTGGRVWPAAATLCRFLARTGAARGQRVLEVGCGTGATGLTCAAALNASSVLLTEGGSDGLLQLARRNVETNRRHIHCEVSVERHSWGDAVDASWAPELIVGSDVTYDRDGHDRLCATLLALGAPALLAHQHRRVASFLSGESQLGHFLEAAERAGLDVDTVHADRANELAPVSILRVTPR
jgi:predicted nicotinamide N-methyase